MHATTFSLQNVAKLFIQQAYSNFTEKILKRKFRLAIHQDSDFVRSFTIYCVANKLKFYFVCSLRRYTTHETCRLIFQTITSFQIQESLDIMFCFVKKKKMKKKARSRKFRQKNGHQASRSSKPLQNARRQQIQLLGDGFSPFLHLQGVKITGK